MYVPPPLPGGNMTWLECRYFRMTGLSVSGRHSKKFAVLGVLV